MCLYYFIGDLFLYGVTDTFSDYLLAFQPYVTEIELVFLRGEDGRTQTSRSLLAVDSKVRLLAELSLIGYELFNAR